MNQHGQIGELPKPGPYNKPNDSRNGDGDRNILEHRNSTACTSSKYNVLEKKKKGSEGRENGREVKVKERANKEKEEKR